MGIDLTALSPKHRAIATRLLAHKKRSEAKVEARLLGGPKYDSQLEADFASFLRALTRSSGRLSDGSGVLEWKYHPMRFRLAPGLSYTPDFGAVVKPRIPAAWEDGKVIGTTWGTPRYRLFEVKGSWKAKNARESRVRLKIAAHLFGFFEWVAVTRERGSWEFEVIGG